jgi:NitT/TauT family transport system ATP-binding protein
MLRIELNNVSKHFIDEDGSVKNVIKDLTLNIENSVFYTLIGPNASGKSTLINLISGLFKPNAGTINSISEKDSIRIGYIWQDYRSTLLPWLNIAENIALPLRIEGKPKVERLKCANDILNKYDIRLDLKEKIYNLSGGQQQLVGLLRGIIINPDLLLFDEPLSALDQLNSWKMAFIIERIWLILKVPVLFISHDIDEAVLLADEILLMSKFEKRIKGVIKNTLPRPRNKEMLSSREHILCRDEAIQFLFEEDRLMHKDLTNG